MSDNNGKDGKESLKDILLGTIFSGKDGAERKIDISTAKDILSGALSWAGKGKDEFLQTLCRETGQALAQSMQGPILEILKDQKISITLELTPKNKSSKSKSKKAKTEDDFD